MTIAIQNPLEKERALVALPSCTGIESLFKELFVPLVFYVHEMIPNQEVSEDIVQEVFAKYWSKFRDCGCPDYAKKYLYRSARNASIDYIRHEKVERRRRNQYISSKNDFALIEDLIAQGEIQNSIERAMSSLPNRCLTVFQLSRDEGLTYGQIAKRMSISIKTVETQMSKALRIFRRELHGLY